MKLVISPYMTEEIIQEKISKKTKLLVKANLLHHLQENDRTGNFHGDDGGNFTGENLHKAKLPVKANLLHLLQENDKTGDFPGDDAGDL